MRLIARRDGSGAGEALAIFERYRADLARRGIDLVERALSLQG